ncbi:TEL2-interacting protein 1, partial [Frankliniella fusca]
SINGHTTDGNAQFDANLFGKLLKVALKFRQVNLSPENSALLSVWSFKNALNGFWRLTRKSRLEARNMFSTFAATASICVLPRKSMESSWALVREKFHVGGCWHQRQRLNSVVNK